MVERSERIQSADTFMFGIRKLISVALMETEGRLLNSILPSGVDHDHDHDHKRWSLFSVRMQNRLTTMMNSCI